VLGAASKVGIPRLDYYFSREASVVQVYDAKQAAEANLRSGYYGWWPDRVDNRQPLVISAETSIDPEMIAKILGVFDYARVEPAEG
jgi:hypothetical protein